MAFTSSSVNRCPLCSVLSAERVADVNLILEPLAARTRATGELPSAQDVQLNEIAHKLQLAPSSMRFHIKECLVQGDIQDQRLVELKDVINALQIAKLEYSTEPTAGNANAYVSLINAFGNLAEAVEGQIDPEVTVQFLIANALSPMTRETLVKTTEELAQLRTNLLALIPQSQHTAVSNHLKATINRLGTKLKEQQQKSLNAICGYYKVELAASTIKRTMTTDIDDPVRAARDEFTAAPSVRAPAPPAVSSPHDDDDDDDSDDVNLS